MPSWVSGEEPEVEGCIALLRSSYFISVAVPLSNMRRQGGLVGGMETSSSKRGICSTVADWVSLLCRRGGGVPSAGW